MSPPSWPPGAAWACASCPCPTTRCGPGSCWPARASLRWRSSTTSSGWPTRTGAGRPVRRRRAACPPRACSTPSPSAETVVVCRRTPSSLSLLSWPWPGAGGALAGAAANGRGLPDRGRVGAEGAGRPPAGRARSRVLGGRRGPPLRRWVGTLVIDEADADLAVSVDRAGSSLPWPQRHVGPAAPPPSSADRADPF